MNHLLGYLPNIPQPLVLGVGFVLAAVVTVHVLLRKRDVASAAAWIGLAWFAPYSGAAAYFVLGVNRVQRRARRLLPQDRTGGRGPPRARAGTRHLDPLSRSVGRLTTRPLLPGNAVDVYENGDQAYPPMLEAIAAAQRSVGLSSYIFRDDAWGGRFIEALADAHGRGVQVRVLIDGVGGGWLRSPAYHHLCRRGIPAARFLHSLLPWRMPFLNLRSHKKILIIDGAVGFTGGMNISDENVMATRPAEPVQDTHFRLRGPAVCQLTEAFAQDWSFATDEELNGDAWYPDILGVPDGPSARIVDSGPDEDVEKIEFTMLEAIAVAQQRIVVMTPYFLPDERMIGALSLASLRGVAVDVIIPEKSDHPFVDWACRPNIGPLLSDGVRIWRSPPPFRHSKMMLVDDEWCLVGSCNWDIRSFRLNFELCLEVYDRALAATLAEIAKRNQHGPLRQDEVDAAPFPVRLRNAAVRLLLPYL